MSNTTATVVNLTGGAYYDLTIGRFHYGERWLNEISVERDVWEAPGNGIYRTYVASPNRTVTLTFDTAPLIGQGMRVDGYDGGHVAVFRKPLGARSGAALPLSLPYCMNRDAHDCSVIELSVKFPEAEQTYRFWVRSAHKLDYPAPKVDVSCWITDPPVADAD